MTTKLNLHHHHQQESGGDGLNDQNTVLICHVFDFPNFS